MKESPLIPIIQGMHKREDYVLVDLSSQNSELTPELIQDPMRCKEYLEQHCNQNKAQLAYGGYLENRDLYAKNDLFQGSEARCIHLGVDFWCDDTHHVLAPFSGRIHSFANNAAAGDYGPTLILEHRKDWSITPFEGYTLYGHLALESMAAWQIGQPVDVGESLARLGSACENGGYAPHLHFQLILDLQQQEGDYPGVCTTSQIEFYTSNCPDPLPLLGL